MTKIQVLIPLYNESSSFVKCFEEINTILLKDNFDPCFVLVDDGSSDLTWQMIKELKVRYKNIKALRLARNFGKDLALIAGINALDDELTIIMDSDLQHPPSCIKPMYELMQKNDADIVEGRKSNRGKESLAYKIFAKSFYKILYKLSGLDMDNSSDFNLIRGEVVASLKSFDERNVFFRGLIDYVGFKKESFEFNVAERAGGQTSFTMKKLVFLAMDAIISYTGKLLYFVFLISLIFMIFSIALVVQTLYNYFSDIAVSGFSTVIIIILISSSLIMLSLGIIGLYLSRIYTEVKARPAYLLKEVLEND